jgi:hypothetical protein
MVKRTLAVLSIFFYLTVPVSTFDNAEYQSWVKLPGNKHLHGAGFFIDWELKNEDWAQQFCNISASRNHRHFLTPPIGHPMGAVPNFIDFDNGDVLMKIICVHNQVRTYIYVAFSWDVAAVWRQNEDAF